MMPTLSWLEDPTVFAVNRLSAHSDHILYATARELEMGETSLRQCLDGTWQFCYSPNPQSRPADFWQEGQDLSAFGSIQVPGHMQTQGYGQIQYINKLYPWDGHSFLRPPHIDWASCHVGSYVRTFDLAPGLRGKPVCISFQGAEQAMFLWLNGHFVGYSEDSFTPADFDLTPYIRETGNRLCVEVYRHCSGGWLESQDFFRFSGLHRSVYLYARMNTSVDDVWLRTRLEEDLTTGRLRLRLRCSGEIPRSLRLKLTHPEDGILFEGELALTEQDGFLWSRELVFPRVRLWDHGSPELYRAVLEVENGGFIPYDIGFRRFGIVSRQLILNGRRLMLRGVNRHEWNPHTGRCVTAADMRAAMDTFHRNNINSVRTCHYPNHSLWYDLCDKEGIYMMDETNLETHGSWQKDMTVDPEWNIPASLPQWRNCVLDRANSMFQRDKNHVSILFWSCGNESYAGTNLVEMADFFRREDPDRVVHYEGVFHCREFDQASDVESRMYATPAEIREYLEKDGAKPYLSCEYMHSMGNSLGGMESYVRLAGEFPQYHGGFLWDYMDQALWHRNALGQTVLGYGGDFGERQTDYAFSANGIVTADGREKPCMQEVRYWHMPDEDRARWDEENARLAFQAQPLPCPGKTEPLTVTPGDGAYGVKGQGFEILFSRLAGGPVSLVTGGREWLWRAPRPAFWRAPTENDCGCGFPGRSALWSAVDSWSACSGYQVTEQTGEAFAIRYDYTAQCMPDLAASITYRVTREGYLNITARYQGRPGRPQLPLFGLRFATARPVEQTIWQGLSGETYPDRYKGASFGIHRETPHISEYLVPQECGNHAFTRWVCLELEGSGLTLEQGDKPFHFSAIPCTPAQLEQAQHRWELPQTGRTVVTVCSDMRGVGGIDTWMTDVEEAYHISGEEDHILNFRIHL